MRKTGTICALFAGLLLSSCDYLTPDPGKEVITAALTGAKVSIGAQRAYGAPYPSNCISDEAQNTNLAIAPNGASQVALQFGISQSAAIRTLYQADAARPSLSFQGKTMTCFEDALYKYYADFMGYVIPLGTVRVSTIEFINDFTSSGLFGGSVETRSYKVGFTIEQEHTTGQGSLPEGFNATCLVAKDPVQNRWIFQGCQ